MTEPRRAFRLASLVLGVGLIALGATIVAPPLPRLVWNASASAPVGLYAVAPGATLGAGDMVVARAPLRVRRLAAARHYLPANVPLMKRVAAVPGDTVCAAAEDIAINGRRIVRRRARDGRGRPMPWWRGCRALAADELLLMMARSPASFDGRYFGPTERRDVIGRARLLWPR